MIPLGLAQTLILMLPTAHGIYVAADSRYDGGDPAKRDQANKVFLCGKRAVCAISGGLILNARTIDGERESEGSLDVAGELERAAAEMAEAPAAEQVEWLVGRMQSAIRAFWDKHLDARRVPTRMSARLGASSVCTILFVRMEESGEGSAHQIQFQFRERFHPDGGWLHQLASPVARPADPARPLAQGATHCMRIRPDEPPAMETREETLKTLGALFERTRDGGACEAVVGGAVDVAVISAEGSRWLARK
jgi:hypothetical protein